MRELHRQTKILYNLYHRIVKKLEGSGRKNGGKIVFFSDEISLPSDCKVFAGKNVEDKLIWSVTLGVSILTGWFI